MSTIENPILNSPFDAPTRHFRFDDNGITNEIVEKRRRSAYFVPIARPKKKGAQKTFETEWTGDRVQENTEINRIRERVDAWRTGGYVGITSTTRRLIEYWSNPARERRLFFCQREAAETAIYITEVAAKYGDAWIENYLRDRNADYNASLPRIAMKMATGSGKTVLMAMLIAWHALNKLENRQDARFSDAFLIVAPGITIRDRLRVLFPSDPDNYYRTLDILPPDLRERLGQARIVITNYHAFLLRERGDAARLTKTILTKGLENPFRETPDQMVRRVCRDLAGKRHIIVINDEAHHCYWPLAGNSAGTDTQAPAAAPSGESSSRAGAGRESLQPSRAQTRERQRRGWGPGARQDGGAPRALSKDDRAEAKQREEDARVWSSGLEAIQRKLGLRAVYDLSATPFFLTGSGYPEGTLFPWVVSDFSLIDAIEAGIVKIPRVPVADNAMLGESPTYRDLWPRIREDLPRKGRKSDAVAGAPKLPVELEGALLSLYGHYEKAFRVWEQNADARARGLTPPVFVVVCNNTNVSKLVFDWIAGWNTGKTREDGSPLIAPGRLTLFNNEEHGAWRRRPNSILVDSQQLESGEGMSPEFKAIAAAEIEEFKREYQARFPGRNVDDLTDEDLLREVMNTVGKAGKLGEQVRCVVSVSMLTEGWDTNTVTHILGVRAFGTQLLCEQVVGRGLRRMSYAVNDQGRFEPEYAEVYGVPFSFIPTAGATETVTMSKSTRVRALDERATLEITFPRVAGYRYDFATERLRAEFSADSRLALSTADVPTWTEAAPIVGKASVHTLDDLKKRRPSEVAFALAKLALEKYFRADDVGRDGAPAGDADANGLDVKAWLFPQLLAISKRWLSECLVSRTTRSHNCSCSSSWRTTPSIASTDRLSQPPKARRRWCRSCVRSTSSAARAGWTSTPPSRCSRPRPASATCRTSSPTQVRGSRSWRRGDVVDAVPDGEPPVRAAGAREDRGQGHQPLWGRSTEGVRGVTGQPAASHGIGDRMPQGSKKPRRGPDVESAASVAALKAWDTMKSPVWRARRTARRSQAALRTWAAGGNYHVVFLDAPSGNPRTGIVDALLVRIGSADPDVLDILFVQLKGGSAGFTPIERTRLMDAPRRVRLGTALATWDGESIAVDVLALPECVSMPDASGRRRTARRRSAR